MQAVETIAPYDLNVENGVQLIYFVARGNWRQGMYPLVGHL